MVGFRHNVNFLNSQVPSLGYYLQPTGGHVFMFGKGSTKQILKISIQTVMPLAKHTFALLTKVKTWHCS